MNKDKKTIAEARSEMSLGGGLTPQEAHEALLEADKKLIQDKIKFLEARGYKVTKTKEVKE